MWSFGFVGLPESDSARNDRFSSVVEASSAEAN
jgi:hypothetical protein